MTTLNGLIIQEMDSGETSKSICALTAQKGVIRIYVRGGRKSSKNSSSTQLFAYSALCVEEKKNAKGQVSYYLNSSESVKMFYNIRLDAKRLALASYFAELLMYCGIESDGCDEVMRLALNTLYFLNDGKKDMDLLKSIFELRLLCEIGMRPELLACSTCMKYEDEIMHFSFMRNNLECSDCFHDMDSVHDFVLDKTLLYIVRFISLTDFNRLFSFKISPNYQEKLTQFTESFIRYHLKSKFKTLEFYKMI